MRKLGAIGILTALLLAGCQEAQITSYTVPREEFGAAKKGPKASAGPRRMLVGMFIQCASVWSFRVDGPEAEVAKQAEAFKTLVQSVRFPGNDEPPTWTMPNGWTQEPGNAFRHATFRVGTLEGWVSRTAAEGEGGSLLSNLTRWRGLVGLPPAAESDLPTDTRPIDVNGVKGTWIDITGPGGKKF